MPAEPSDAICFRTRSGYSSDGSAPVRKLVRQAACLGYRAITLTDRTVVKGVSALRQEAEHYDLKPIFGVELKVRVNDPDCSVERPEDHGDWLTLLAETDSGLGSLFRLSSQAASLAPEIPITLSRMNRDVIVIAGGDNSRLYELVARQQIRLARRYLTLLIDLFGHSHVYVGLPFPSTTNRPVIEAMVGLAGEKELPLVCGHLARYTHPEEYSGHQALQQWKTGERPAAGSGHENFLPSPRQIEDAFGDWPQVIDCGGELIDRCNATLWPGSIAPFEFRTNTEESAPGLLRRLVLDGVNSLYLPDKIESARSRAESELSVIEDRGLTESLLTVWDLVEFARNRGIDLGPGRGAMPGSIVCFALGITQPDPLEHDLLFSRFVGSFKSALALDVPVTRRQELIDYLKRRHGSESVMPVTNFQHARPPRAIEIAAATYFCDGGMTHDITDLLPPPNLGRHRPLSESVESGTELRQIMDHKPVVADIMRTALQVEGSPDQEFPNSVTVALADPDSEIPVPVQSIDLHSKTPSFTSIQRGQTTTQVERHDLDRLGVATLDLVRLRDLAQLSTACQLVRENHDVQIDLKYLPLDDAATFELFRRVDTEGVFAFNHNLTGRALLEIQPTEFNDLVAIHSLCRPGADQVIPEYAKRKHDPATVKYRDERLRPITESTYGLLLYQEQVMRIAMEFADFSAEEADDFRKALGKRKRKDVLRMKEQFLDQTPSEDSLGLDLWDFCEQATDYTFNKAHAVSYAMLSYRSAWLKTHFPDEFEIAMRNVIV